MELIDKVAVVAEIERLSAYYDSLHEQRIIEKILSIIDTLEVKEVDFPYHENRDKERGKELALSLQIQAYLNTASDELYKENESHKKGIHECMRMWVKLHNYYFYNNTLEMKEVDLEKEIKDYIHALPHAKTGVPNGWRLSWHEDEVMKVAKHFFELGMKVSNKTKKDVSYVKIDRKVLFEMCDAILNHDGYADRDDCPENDSPYFVDKWDSDFRKKVENIRNNS